MNNSKFAFFIPAVAAVFLLGEAPSQGSVVINIGGQSFFDASGELLAPGTLLQLIHCGIDGVPNLDVSSDQGHKTLRLDDANGSQWVMGDDSLLAVAFTTGGGAVSDFVSAAAFDLAKGADTAGTLDRVFEFATGAVPSGTKLALRWFPGLQATNFAAITLQFGQQFGEFTRLATPVNGGNLWVVPSDGANVTFDPLFTTDAGGFDPMGTGRAMNLVVPEPCSAALALLGGIPLLGRRYRRRLSRIKEAAR